MSNLVYTTIISYAQPNNLKVWELVNQRTK